MMDHSSYRGASVHSKLGLINVVLLPKLQFYMNIKQIAAFSWYLTPPPTHPHPAVCFRKRQLWLTFKEQYFILRKKNWPCEVIFIGFWPVTLFSSIFLRHGYIRRISGAQRNLQILKTRNWTQFYEM